MSRRSSKPRFTDLYNTLGYLNEAVAANGEGIAALNGDSTEDRRKAGLEFLAELRRSQGKDG